MYSKGQRPAIVIRGEADVASHAAFVLGGDDHIGNESCKSSISQARIPQPEAEVFLPVRSNQMPESLVVYLLWQSGRERAKILKHLRKPC